VRCLRITSTCTRGGLVVVPGVRVLGRAWIARSAWARLVGLLGTDRLARDQLVLLAPCSAVHGIGLRVRIGVAFVDPHGVVLRVVDPLPWWGARVRGAAAVLEAASGVLSGIGPGDRISLTGASLFPHRGHFPARAWGSNRRRGALSGHRGHTVPANDRRT
jgi:uncharacterized membrane protein (UPF0127 family)